MTDAEKIAAIQDILSKLKALRAHLDRKTSAMGVSYPERDAVEKISLIIFGQAG